MSKVDVQGELIPFPFKPGSTLATVVGDSPVIPGEIIEAPSTIIVVSPLKDLPQYAKTAGQYYAVNMPLDHVENAKHNTGGYSVRVPRLPLPAELVANAKKGDIIGNEMWAAVVGDQKDTPFIVTSSNINPLTGEVLTPPVHSPNILQFPQSQTQNMEATIPQPLPNTPSSASNIEENPYLGPLTELPKAA